MGHSKSEMKVRSAAFRKSPPGDGIWINGGFFVLEPGIFDYLEGGYKYSAMGKKTISRNSKRRPTCGLPHYDFWKSMDALRDKIELEELWQSGNAPWKIW
jgi:glucose-1-phosphate cytidylyltransferase